MENDTEPKRVLGNYLLNYHVRIPWAVQHFANKEEIEESKQYAKHEMGLMLKIMESEVPNCTKNNFIYEVDFGSGRLIREGYIGIWLDPIADIVRGLPRNKIGEIMWKDHERDLNQLKITGKYPITPLQTFDVTYRVINKKFK